MIKYLFYISTLVILCSQLLSKEEEAGKININKFVNFQSFQPGSVFSVFLKIDIEKGWHIYWKNAGSAGLPTKFEWIVPEDVTLISEEWEIPGIFPFGEYSNIGYENTVGFLFHFKTAKKLRPDDIKLKCHISWLICKEGCYPGSDSIEISLIFNNQSVRAKGWENLLQKTIKNLPIEGKEFKVVAIQQIQNLVLNITKGGIEKEKIQSAKFIPNESGFLSISDQVYKLKKNALELTIKMDELRENDPDSLSGLLLINRVDNTKKTYNISINNIKNWSEP